MILFFLFLTPSSQVVGKFCFYFDQPQGVRASAGVCYWKEGRDKSKDGGGRQSGAMVLFFCNG